MLDSDMSVHRCGVESRCISACFEWLRGSLQSFSCSGTKKSFS